MITKEIIEKTSSFIDSDDVWRLIITSPLYLNFFNDLFTLFEGDKLDMLIEIHNERNNRLGDVLKELKKCKLKTGQISLFP